MRIFDTHVHFKWWASGNYVGQNAMKRGADGFLEALAEKAQELGMTKIALLGNPGAKNHDALEAALSAYPDLLVGLGWLRLDEDPPGLIDEFHMRGFHGIKILGVSRNYDDEKYYRHYEKAQARGMRLLFHTGILGGPIDYLVGGAEDAWKAIPTGKDEAELVARLGREARGRAYGFSSARMQPIYLDTIAFAFPELYIIGAHLGWPDYRTACAIARWRPRLYFDVSGGDVVRDHIVEGGYVKNEINPLKLTYGSDCDLDRMKHHIDAWKRAFDEMGLSQEEQDAVFYRNAARMFGFED